jgi:hypothetical protein
MEPLVVRVFLCLTVVDSQPCSFWLQSNPHVRTVTLGRTYCAVHKRIFNGCFKQCDILKYKT